MPSPAACLCAHLPHDLTYLILSIKNIAPRAVFFWFSAVAIAPRCFVVPPRRKNCAIFPA